MDHAMTRFGVALLLVCSACHSLRQQATRPPLGADQFEGIVDIGGPKLHVVCAGRGEPVVILDSGFGDGLRVWERVMPEVARFARVCAYDRLGLGESSAAPRKHRLSLMARELHSLLGRVAPARSYVLVGHSLAGLTTRLYASEFADEVTGLVLVDSMTEEQDARYWSLLPAEQAQQFRLNLEHSAEGVDWETFAEGMADVHRSNTFLGAKPLVVLTAAKQHPTQISPSLDAEMARVWSEMQAELLRLSSNGVQVIAKDAGHYIHVEQPALVVAAIREVVHAARSGEHVRKSLASQ
jgi:pimeloyl-ACP methyl ester carboxylesterase